MEKELKIFELRWADQGEKEWVCAYTNIGALKEYESITETSLINMDVMDEIIEVPREKWGEYKIKNADYDGDPGDWKEKTFEEYMKDQKHPDIIAGTMYL